jgi:hypothetical protein
MPTIEIVSVNATDIGLTQLDFQVAIIEEYKLEGHRSLFYDHLLQYQGTIVHIGNPDFRTDKDNGFFAGHLIDWEIDSKRTIIIPQGTETGKNQQYQFKFLDYFRADIEKILEVALDRSPDRRVLFLTDYQFGPETAEFEIIYTIMDFWSLHDKDGLRFNTLYEMYGL